MMPANAFLYIANVDTSKDNSPLKDEIGARADVIREKFSNDTGHRFVVSHVLLQPMGVTYTNPLVAPLPFELRVRGGLVHSGVLDPTGEDISPLGFKMTGDQLYCRESTLLFGTDEANPNTTFSVAYVVTVMLSLPRNNEFSLPSFVPAF